MPGTLTRGVTLDEFLQMEDPADGSQLELVNGEVISMPPPKANHGIICVEIGAILRAFVKPRKLGWVTGNDTGVIIPGRRDSMRGVDVGFWNIADNPVRPIGYFETLPDLAVEVNSPSNGKKMIRDKLKQYINAGVKLVWVVDPDDETVTVYHGNTQGVVHGDDDILDGYNVLPGFSCKVSEFFQ